MGKWLALSVLLVGCALVAREPSFPFPTTKAVVENAEVGSFGMCESGEQVFFVRTRHGEKVYQLWMTDTRFVAAEYVGDEAGWPTVVYWGTLTLSGELRVSKMIPFDPKGNASPCDWLVVA